MHLQIGVAGMAKYNALELFLSNCSWSEVTLSFSEMEAILGFSLPRSAYTYAAWWANGGHTHALSWMNGGFAVARLDLRGKIVTFRRDEAQQRTSASKHASSPVPKEVPSHSQTAPYTSALDEPVWTVFGYPFRFLQQLIPESENGNIREFYPQKDYRNENNLPLLHHGSGSFCRFSIDAPSVAGVYLWVVEDHILYIGETANLRKRFNMGYGNISPRNCYVGGQSTNCKMNKVVMEYAKMGTPIRLYFYPTDNYKQVELDLLRHISTKFNVKDN